MQQKTGWRREGLMDVIDLIQHATSVEDVMAVLRAYVEAAGSELAALGPFRKDLVIEQN